MGLNCCELCGKDGEDTRPYGPNGENICWECGQKDPVTTFKKTIKRMLGIDLPDELAERGARDLRRVRQQREAARWN